MKLIQPPLALLPWSPSDQGLMVETALVQVYERLHAEDLYRIVFHENPSMTFAQFMGFFSRENVLTQLCVDITDEQVPKLAGLVWLAEFEQLPSHRRATGSFCFFRNYWNRKWTTGFGRMVLEYWFTDLKLDVLIGMTPQPNRAARLFSRHMGLRYLASLPGYSSFHGRQVDASVAMLTRKEWEVLYRREGVAVGVV